MLRFDPGTIVAMDRAYVDFTLLNNWTTRGVFLVTRAKSDMAYRVLRRLPVLRRGTVLCG
jgi:hypothetical protein